MSDKGFVDSNIILYAYSVDEKEKAEIANSLLLDHPSPLMISTQVINEITSVLLRKFQMDPAVVRSVMQELNDVFPVVTFDIGTQQKAMDIYARYHLQYYDALILATAIENGCSVLYSEDMQHEQVIENRLKIINPFYLSTL